MWTRVRRISVLSYSKEVNHPPKENEPTVSTLTQVDIAK